MVVAGQTTSGKDFSGLAFIAIFILGYVRRGAGLTVSNHSNTVS